jgi:cytochrome c55X
VKARDHTVARRPCGALRVASAARLQGVARALCMAFASTVATVALGAAAPDDAARLARLVRHDCGSCHGLTLKGGLGPALTASALEGKPATYVRDIILHGRPGTAMPPWSPFLSASEAEWIAARLLTGFPDAR